MIFVWNILLRELVPTSRERRRNKFTEIPLLALTRNRPTKYWFEGKTWKLSDSVTVLDENWWIKLDRLSVLSYIVHYKALTFLRLYECYQQTVLLDKLQFAQKYRLHQCVRFWINMSLGWIAIFYAQIFFLVWQVQ